MRTLQCKADKIRVLLFITQLANFTITAAEEIEIARAFKVPSSNR